MSSHHLPHAQRLKALRAQLIADKLDGFVVPLTDVHLSEYVGEDAKRLEWLTGFGGSAGSAVVLADKAAIFVDGRYTVQVRTQVDGSLFAYENVPATSTSRWLGENVTQYGRIGYDPWLHTTAWVKSAKAALADKGGALVAMTNNPLDKVWVDRPPPSSAPAIVHPITFSGQSSEEKRAAIAAWLTEQRVDSVALCALDSIAWAFNIRGTDVSCTPVVLAFALVHQDGSADLFIDESKVDATLRGHLGAHVWLHPYESFATALNALAGKRVMVDPERSVAAIYEAMSGAEIIEARDPCVLPKAVKNPVEIAGAKAAHLRDGAALTHYLHWLAQEAYKGNLTELSAAAKLYDYRRETILLHDLSFDTISAAGANAALPHYRVDEASNQPLRPNSIYLCDSGGQYQDGTTDVTRTIWVGPNTPPAEVRDRFTRVLKGHIAVDQAIFPKGTRGSQLDTLARQFLWAEGLDYAHGTGHGVGSFLSVHEGPQRIAAMAGGQAGGDEPLQEGMIISNEPGYYKAGAYGIRIENLVVVEPRAPKDAEGEFFGFEAITLAPIDRALVDVALLSPAEYAWLNAYHARVLREIGALVDADTKTWLAKACAPL